MLISVFVIYTLIGLQNLNNANTKKNSGSCSQWIFFTGYLQKKVENILALSVCWEPKGSFHLN